MAEHIIQPISIEDFIGITSYGDTTMANHKFSTCNKELICRTFYLSKTVLYIVKDNLTGKAEDFTDLDTAIDAYNAINNKNLLLSNN